MLDVYMFKPRRSIIPGAFRLHSHSSQLHLLELFWQVWQSGVWLPCIWVIPWVVSSWSPGFLIIMPFKRSHVSTLQRSFFCWPCLFTLYFVFVTLTLEPQYITDHAYTLLYISDFTAVPLALFCFIFFILLINLELNSTTVCVPSFVAAVWSHGL